MGTMVVVATLPKCDFCDLEATYDGKTIHGPWAYMCVTHWITRGVGALGTGVGQRLVLEADS